MINSIREPKPGDIIYVKGSYFIDRGEDDFRGGKATVSRVIRYDECPNPYNRLFVTLLEHPGAEHNWRALLEQQEELAARYGEQWATPDPDPACAHLVEPLDPRFTL